VEGKTARGSNRKEKSEVGEAKGVAGRTDRREESGGRRGRGNGWGKREGRRISVGRERWEGLGEGEEQN